ncbi:carbohydrate kinase family protein [Neorhizobium galegae]|uniref:carbohydrate kinase family protein n=1 Tax=Neorhizobium galegae TaxID=399 RepID=UPI002105CAD3|nr:carbohydrate kinase family protein [Neorhizobium galegae]MCQ1764713.1 carbohydrate kinase family protein [Neorhizobium galegae]MCQ1849284.1 carbohydrate kinase family protein [Neorhizobium galegae]
MAISSLSAGVTLHCYDHLTTNETSDRLSALGVALNSRLRPHAIVFVYFHPLSNPYIEPQRAKIARCQPIEVEGTSIVRFGLLEGTARVQGLRVTYDPQSQHEPEPFLANGSSAGELALVMNEDEFKAYARTDDHNEGANRLFASGDADVVVIKRGVFGAIVYLKGSAPVSIPIYRSARTFKIGTGDVFSAIFAHYWGSKGRSAAEAADLASRAVSVYCADPVNPLKETAFIDAHPILGTPPTAVRIFGARNTLGRRYTLQEAAFCIEKLGVSARLTEGLEQLEINGDFASLVLADGMTEAHLSALLTKHSPCVVLDEEGKLETKQSEGTALCRDFTSAIYQVCQSAPKLK